MRSIGERQVFPGLDGEDARPGQIFWPAALGAAALALLAVYGGVGRAPRPEVAAGVLTPTAPFGDIVRFGERLGGG